MSTDNNIRIYYNGNILTVDDRFSTCTAMATQGDRILAMGSDAELLALKDRAVASYDLYGRTVMPGLNDMHAHMDREGLKTVYPSLAGAKSIEDILARIAELVKAAKPGEWIVTMPIGNPPSYWTPQDELKEKRWPTRWDLDQVSPNNPVYIRPIWGFWRHALPITSIANSRALEVCGINRNTPSPAPSVVIEKDSNGEPTGIFNEDTYMSVVEMTLMRPAGGFTHKDRVAALGRAMDAYVSFGTTSVYEEHGAAGELIAAYRTLRESGPLTVRANLLFSPSWSTVPGADPERLLGSWGAWLGGRGLGDNYLRTSGRYVLLEAEGDVSDMKESGPELFQIMAVRLEAETWLLRHRQCAGDRFRPITIGHGFESDTEIFDEAGFGLRRDQMQGRKESRAVIRRVRSQRDAIDFGQRNDLAKFGNAADLYDAWLDV